MNRIMGFLLCKDRRDKRLKTSGRDDERRRRHHSESGSNSGGDSPQQKNG